MQNETNMGFFRLFFALCVVIIHAYPLFGYTPVSSPTAVHSFFVISGFYMALILHEKYVGKNGSYKLFLGNRFLRIYPLYWTVLILLLAFSLLKGYFLPSQENALKMLLHEGDVLTGILRNITLIFTTDYFHQNFHNIGYLLLLPAWTLQVELLFYLLAPILAKNKAFFLILLALPFAIITFTNALPLFHSDSSLTYVFISKFIFFILGMLSYELYRKIKNKSFSKKYNPLIFISLFCLILLFEYFSWRTIVSYLMLSAALPFIFIFSKKQRLDAFLADLSYPVYLSHILVFKVISNTPLATHNETTITLLTIVATLLFSYLLVRLIEKPIDRLRQQRLR